MSDPTRHSGDPRIGLRLWRRPDLERKRIARVWRVTAVCDASWSTFRDESEAKVLEPGLKATRGLYLLPHNTNLFPRNTIAGTAQVVTRYNTRCS
jgi:hypothetical protein